LINLCSYLSKDAGHWKLPRLQDGQFKVVEDQTSTNKCGSGPLAAEISTCSRCTIVFNNIEEVVVICENTRLYSRGSNSGFSVKKKCPLAESQLEKCRMVNPKKCRIVTPQRWTAFSRGQEDLVKIEESEVYKCMVKYGTCRVICVVYDRAVYSNTEMIRKMQREVVREAKVDLEFCRDLKSSSCMKYTDSMSN
jgi:hypothetical protein